MTTLLSSHADSLQPGKDYKPDYANLNLTQEEQSVSFLGVTLKPGVTRRAFFNYLLAFFLSIEILTLVSTSGYFLIHDDYKAGSHTEVNNILTSLTFWSQIWAIPFVPISGLLHDYAGRRIMFISGAAICTVALAVFPYCQHVYPGLLIVRIILEQGIVQLLTNPLAADYVINQKKGLASAYAGIASGLGAILAALGLLGIGRKTGWASVFLISAGIAFLSCLYMAFTMQNRHQGAPQARCPLLPQDEANHQRPSDASSLDVPSRNVSKIDSTHANRNCLRTLWDKIKTAASESRNVVILTAYLGSFTIRACDVLMTVFVISYVNAYDYDPDDAEAVSHTISGIGSVIGLFVAILAGYLTDKIGFGFLGVLTYLIPGICYILVVQYNNNDVKSSLTYGLMMTGASFVQAGIVVNNMMINRVLRKDVKGTIMGIFIFFGSVGVLVLTKVGNNLYDDGQYGAAFTIGGWLSIATAFFTFLLWVSGAFNKALKQVDRERDY